MNDLPALPNTKEFEVPKEIKDVLKDRPGTEDPQRILIFDQNILLGKLETTQYLWLADRTFKLSHEFFFQLSSIYTSINGYNLPHIHTLQPKKCKRNVWTNADSCLKNFYWNRTRILTDFEKVVMKAFQNTFTAKSPTECYFHFCWLGSHPKMKNSFR